MRSPRLKITNEEKYENLGRNKALLSGCNNRRR